MRVKTLLVMIDICLIILCIVSFYESNIDDLRGLIVLLSVGNIYFINEIFETCKNKNINIDLDNILKKVEDKLNKIKED